MTFFLHSTVKCGICHLFLQEVIVIVFSLPQNHYRYGISHKIICMYSICHSKMNALIHLYVIA